METACTPGEKCDTETLNNVPRDPRRGPLARVGDSFDITDKDGQLVRLTFLRVIDPADVKYFDGGRDDFPRQWRGDWYGERRHVAIRLRARWLDSRDTTRFIGTLLGVMDPALRLSVSDEVDYKPHPGAWSLGASPVDGDQVRSVLFGSDDMTIGAIFPVPRDETVDYLSVSLGKRWEWQLGAATTLTECRAEYALGLMQSFHHDRYALIAKYEGCGDDPFRVSSLPTPREATRIVKDAYLRGIIEGRIAPAEGVRRLYKVVFPRVEAALGKEPAWEELGLEWLLGPYMQRSLAVMHEQDERDALIVEACKKVQNLG